MQNRAEIQTMIADVEKKLADTKAELEGQRSPVTDALRVVIPMMEDQLKIMRALVWMD